MPRRPVFMQAASHFPEILFALACAMAAGSAIAQSPPDPDHGRPVELVARDLGVTPEQFREAFKKVRPAPRGELPTESQRKANRKARAEALGVSPERLDAVMDKYRPRS